MISAWPCPAAAGGPTPEYALSLDRGRRHRLLVVPALFDEANRLRRFTVELLRELDGCGIDCLLPDLPGTNESLQPLAGQSLAGWQTAMTAAALHFRATRVLAMRGGALAAPRDLPGWSYAAVSGEAVLRHMVRMRILAAREAGREETQAALLATGLREGLELGGYALGPAMIAGLQGADPPELTAISQADIGGPGLWLRAEPDEAPAQSRALAASIAGALG